MRTRLILLGTVMLLALWFVASSQAQYTRRGRLVLFTTQEAHQLRFAEGEWRGTSRTRSLSLGPRIVIRLPEVRETATGHVIQTTSPTNLVIAFEETSAPVNMGSLQVRAKKGWFTKSLTSLLTPHVRGTGLAAEGVEIPVGRFRVEIEIADVYGEKTLETYGLEVGK